MIFDNDIIAAISTPVGDGAISIVRVSGRGSIDFVDNMFEGSKKISEVTSHTIHYGNLSYPKGTHIDEVLVSVFRGPNSYTGEDMVEINCHGGWFVTNLVFKALLEKGARMAEPGEFTKRAFLNGRIDLSQAEAVADLIKAKSDLAHKASIMQLEGIFSKKINEINDNLINLICLIELELDFVEENLVFTNKEMILNNIDNTSQELKKLADSYKFGKLHKEGIKLIIVGKPNVGKSSLLNLLLQENRAIVTPIPGTTRDIIEENFNINGALFRVTDTAGLRDTVDFVEIEGVKRTYEKINESDIILFIIDISQKDFREDINLLSSISELEKSLIIVFNKVDLIQDSVFHFTEFEKRFPQVMKCKISALKGEGLETLKDIIFESVFSGCDFLMDSSIYITNERHRQALLETISSLEFAKQSTLTDQSGEFITIDLRAALDSLGKIIGKTTPEDILNNIFSNFCIGK